VFVHPPGRSIWVQEFQHIAAQVEARVSGIEDEMEWLNDDAFYGNEACNKVVSHSST
jgi:hypothetical protein